MARHRSHGGHRPSPEHAQALQRARARSGGSHRLPGPPPSLRGRAALTAIAAGALVAAGAAVHADTLAGATDDLAIPLLPSADGKITLGVGGAHSWTPSPILITGDTGNGQLASLVKGERISAEQAARAEREAREAEAQRAAQEAEAQRAREAEAQRAARAAAEARRPLYVRPAAGVLTSGYGQRSGTMHWGIDIANRIGTPILSAADGVIVESGPASGFGLWVRVRHTDGTVTIYGHIDRSLVREGQQVKAGQQIATMGNRGDSTGPHLHFEVWNPSGAKINPLTWLRSKGVQV